MNGTGINCYVMGQTNMSHGQSCKNTYSTPAKCCTTRFLQEATQHQNRWSPRSCKDRGRWGQGRRQQGASGARPSHLKSVPPHFTFGPPVAAYIQYCILKMCSPFCFLAPPAATSWRRAWVEHSGTRGTVVVFDLFKKLKTFNFKISMVI